MTKKTKPSAHVLLERKLRRSLAVLGYQPAKPNPLDPKPLLFSRKEGGLMVMIDPTHTMATDASSKITLKTMVFRGNYEGDEFMATVNDKFSKTVEALLAKTAVRRKFVRLFTLDLD